MAENINPKYKELILRAMEYHFPGAAVYLFGSRARGTNKEGADIDIAFEPREEPALHEISRARVTLNNLPFALKVDLVDMRDIPIELKELILREGIKWKN
jgi:predicted nucleotidyltransferase